MGLSCSKTATKTRCNMDPILSGIFVVVCGIFSCIMWDLVPQPGIEPGSPALGAWSLNHWTTKEVPRGIFKAMILATVGPYVKASCCMP